MYRGRCVFSAIFFASFALIAPFASEQKDFGAVQYLNLSTPQVVLAEAQVWEGKEFPHTMSVLELNRDGFRYWGWYGLNEGTGIGLARSNDLVHWTKYERNPLWTNARWPSVLGNTDPKDPALLYFAITRDYYTPQPHVVLATSRDGIHIEEEKILVAGVPQQRNSQNNRERCCENPNLFHDPVSGQFFLTFYRGNNNDHFEIISRRADKVTDLDKAPDKIIIRSNETIAAPTLLYVASKAAKRGIYYLTTEIYPYRYMNNPEGEWQVKGFYADAPDGDFQPVAGNPIMRGNRACLFQHIFHDRFYGFDCHLTTAGDWELEEVEAPLP